MVSVGLPPPEVGIDEPSVTYRLSNSHARQLGSRTESPAIGAEARAAEDVVRDPCRRIARHLHVAVGQIVAIRASLDEDLPALLGQHVHHVRDLR